MIKPLATVARKMFAVTGRNLKQNQTQGLLPSAATDWESEEEGRDGEVEREREGGDRKRKVGEE